MKKLGLASSLALHSRCRPAQQKATDAARVPPLTASLAKLRIILSVSEGFYLRNNMIGLTVPLTTGCWVENGLNIGKSWLQRHIRRLERMR